MNKPALQFKTEVSGTINRTMDMIIQELKNHGHEFNVCYDIGANKCKWFQERSIAVESSANWYLFEANPEHKGNGVHPPNKFFNVCLSNVDDKEVTFYLPDDKKVHDTGASYYREITKHYAKGDRNKLLKTKKLDTLVNENVLPLPDFVKMDTQGSELDILEGGQKAIGNAKVVICECPVMWYNKGAPSISDYVNSFYKLDFVPSGVDHLAIRKGIFNQVDVVFVKKDIVQAIYNYQDRYKGF